MSWLDNEVVRTFLAGVAPALMGWTGYLHRRIDRLRDSDTTKAERLATIEAKLDLLLEHFEIRKDDA